MKSTNFKRLITLLLAVITLATLLAGCSGSGSTADAGSSAAEPGSAASDAGSEPAPATDAEEATGEKIFRTYSTSAVSNFNPYLDSTTAGHPYTHSSLYRYYPNEDKTSTISAPDLAAGEPYTEDGLTWYIEIDQNAKWANGEPINADTFIYSWKQALDPVTLYTYGSTLAENSIKILNAEEYYMQASTGVAVDWEEVGIKKVDDYTLAITTDGKYPVSDVMRHFIQVASAPVYEELYEQTISEDRANSNYGTEIELSMSSGPFVIESWSKGTEVSYVKNENYLHADEIYLDGINVRVIADESTRLELFEKGELDFLTLGTTGQAQYGDDPRVYFYEAFAVQEIEFNFENPDKPFLSNVNFRKALFYATDRETLAAISGNAPANYFLGRRLVAYADGTSIGQLRDEAGYLGDNYSYDPDLAVEYFEKALEETGYDKFSIELIYSEDNESRRVISEYLQSAWQNLFGADRFELTLRVMDNTALRSLMWTAQDGPTNGWELAWGSWDLDITYFSPNRKFEMYTSTDPRRFSNYNDAVIDELYARSISEEARLDEELKAELTLEMEQEYLNNVLALPVYNVSQYYLYSDRVHHPVSVRIPSYQFGDVYMDYYEEE